MQGLNGCTTRWSFPDDAQAVFVPGKVLALHLPARVVKRGGLAGDRIDCRLFVGLVAITSWATEA